MKRSIETRSLPTLTRSYPRHFTFYVADPISSIRAVTTGSGTEASFAASVLAKFLLEPRAVGPEKVL